jgi:4-hydroxybenzoate polyprenyltransferase
MLKLDSNKIIVTSWALFVFCISWNFVRDISTVFEEIKHLRSRAPENILPDY